MTHRKDLGIAIVGAGRIGALRAQLAAAHPAVRFIAIADVDAARARDLAQKVGAAFHSGDNLQAISRPEVDAVIVATSEGEHTAPVLQALERGKAVLVEKPIALDLAGADRIVAEAARRNADLRVGYSRRYKERYLIAKEQVLQGRVGRIVGAAARVFNSRAQALAMLRRNPHATPVVDALTYYVDLMNWLLEGAQVSEVFARGQMGVLKAAGYDTHDVSWAILTYGDGAVVNLGVSYALPEKYPALGHAARVEVLGTDGVMILDDDHTDQLDVHGQRHAARLPAGSRREHGVPAERHAGRLGAGRVLGPDRQRDARLARSPRARQALRARDRAARPAHTLEVTLAIERSAGERQADRAAARPNEGVTTARSAGIRPE